MKVIAFTFLFVFIYSSYSYSQKESFTVKSGETYNEAIPPGVRYCYPQFVVGNVFYRDGTASSARLDYNYLLGEMQFIAANNDTLSLDNERTIKMITINNDTFYYSRVYVELLASQPLVKLAKSEKIKLGDTKKIGAYNQATSSSAITTVSSFYTNTGVSILSQRQDLVLYKETAFYIGDSYNNFLEASKKNVMKLFGRQNALIESYLKENNTRFNKEEDLNLLINYLQKIL